MRQFHASDSFLPETTSTLNIGSDLLRWLEGFFANLDVSVRATVPTPVNATDAATKAYVDSLFVPVIATVQEADLSPSITNPTTLRFDQADGFVISEPSAGIARVDLDDIPYSVIQDVSSTDRVLGRSTAGAGVIEEITCTAAGRALIDDATAAAQRTTLGSTTVGDAVFIAASAAAARTAIGAVIGTNVEAWDADLDALAALAATAGMLSRTGAGAFAVRTLTGTASNISVADGTGAAANPTFDLVDAGPGATGPIGSATVTPIVTIDAKGRVTALTSATITAGPSAASQAEMEAATSTTVYASPGTTQNHPGVAKTWNTHNNTGTITASYNVTSITDTDVGDHTVVVGTDFSAAAITIVGGDGGASAKATFATVAVGSYDMNGINLDTPFSAADLGEWFSAAYGDQ